MHTFVRLKKLSEPEPHQNFYQEPETYKNNAFCFCIHVNDPKNEKECLIRTVFSSYLGVKDITVNINHLNF
jgi:hypothetical protein